MPLVVLLKFLAPQKRMLQTQPQPVVSGGVSGDAGAESDARMSAEDYRGCLLDLHE